MFVVDDDPSARRGLSRLVRAAGIAVETFPSAAAFQARERHGGPGCIVLDVQMPGVSGPQLQQELQVATDTMPIVFLSGHGDVPTTAQAMKRGAVDFLTKPVDRKELLGAVQAALRKSEQALQTHSELAAIRARLSTLTPREREVMTHVIAGLPNKQIAFELAIAEETVKIHRGRMMAKMAVGSVAELVRLAAKAGVEPAAIE